MTNETNKLKTYTMQELYKQPIEPVEYLVDGLLAPGLYILGGSPKVGKSWMALLLCLAVCGGKAFLGRKTTQAEVLLPGAGRWPTAAGRRRAGRAAPLPPGGTHRAGPGAADRGAACGTSAYPAGGSGYAAKGAVRKRQRTVL